MTLSPTVQVLGMPGGYVVVAGLFNACASKEMSCRQGRLDSSCIISLVALARTNKAEHSAHDNSVTFRVF